jgi:two-component system CheB/CheR fusion protein
MDELQEKKILNNLELRVPHASGEITTLIASIQLIVLDSTEALLMSFIDISERVQAEQQIHALAYELTKAEQEERQRISRILHDELQQRIFAAKVQTLNVDESYRQGDVETAQADLSRIRDILDESISMTRNLSIDLSPAILDGEGLSEALQWLAAQMREQYGLDVDIETNGVSTRFEEALRILLFQAVREALFNVVKHSETLQSAVTVTKDEGLIQITIGDGGAGFQSAALDLEHGMGGLAHIRRRVELMGCSLHLQSQPGEGTRVVLQIPSRLVIS